MRTVFANYAGETMVDGMKAQGSTDEWIHAYRYNGTGLVAQHAYPSAVSGYTQTRNDLLNFRGTDYEYLKDTDGLIEVTNYAADTTATEPPPPNPPTSGDAEGYVSTTYLYHGDTDLFGFLQSSNTYWMHTAPAGSQTTTVFVPADLKVFRDTGGLDPQTTAYSFPTWATNGPDPTVRIQSQVITPPVVSTAQNGPGSGATQTHTYDNFGWRTQLTVVDGISDSYRNDTSYDLASGAVTQQTRDATGLNLVTDYLVDNLGRVTKRTDPGTGSNRNVTYFVYRDPLYQVRVYPGWDTATNRPTGPTIVTREHRPAAGSSQKFWTETVSMTATPIAPGGVPDGTEALGSYQSLTRTQTNDAGQVQYLDRYFNLTGLTGDPTTGILPVGTKGTHLYQTEYTYDNRGRLKDVINHQGTITRTAY